jgi:rhamnogalacturonyl hydrolase YesR
MSAPLRPALTLLVVVFALLPFSASADTVSSRQFITQAESMADAQLAQFAGQPSGIGWVPAVMWAGYADLSHASSKSAYRDAIDQLGDSVQWTPTFRSRSPFHADDLCICQTFLDAYVTKPDPAHLTPSELRIDAVSDNINKERPYDPSAKGTQLTWWWCDALFMAPASHARLSLITGNNKYLDAMDKEWWKTADLLYDKDEHLFYRDKSFLSKRTRSGKKVFWSRGNGWVFAGLARTLPYIPQSYPSRARYIAIFKAMAAKLAALQQPDGTWSPSLLDRDEFPDSETSGTALDCFAYAWGINSGLLDRATYLPVVAKAWAALLAARRPDGILGYVQHTGAGPASVTAADTQLYGVGAFLMAACQLAKLAPLTIPSLPHLSSTPVSPIGPVAPAASPAQ